MSFLLPVHRPRVGLSFTERGLALVELRRGWGKPALTRVSERPLPEGVLRASATEPNLRDRATVERELRVLLQQTSERTVAVCLPDRACHLAVFPFETVPPRAHDREPIVRWRFQHEAHVAVGDARIHHRVFPVKSARATAPAGTTPEGQVAAYVLAMAFTRSVLAQYEQVCQQAGVIPISISCASLWLFDFYRPVIAQGADLFFVHQASDSMTFLAIRQGLPVFCRTKGQRHEQGDVLGEIRSTVQFYEDLHPSAGAAGDSASVPIYMVGEGSSQRGLMLKHMVEVSHVTTRKHADLVPLTIRPDWTTMISTKSVTVSSAGGLYALACAGGR